MDQVINYVGIIVGVGSLVFAVVQTVKLSKIRKLRINSLRSALQNCRLIMAESDRLLNNQKAYDLENQGALIKVQSIHSNACGLIRSLFHELSQVDLPYNKRKLKLYVSLDLISSKSLWKQAAL
ncbi:hypothetical protein AMJ44_12890, partial [candidate division WOR-1 bacterium DG_54_3]